MMTERMNFIREVRPSSMRIQLQRKIGQGLSSQVFEARRIDSRGLTSQSVAVKITKTPDDIQSLKREFETLLQVQSAHLVQVYAWDNHEDQSLLSMELIDGISLVEIFEANVLDRDLIEEIITQMQEGLRALSQKDLKHGDVSLSNVLIGRDGIVKLIDFANPDRSRDFIHGTPPYLAPEIWDGQACTIQSDLFALGLVREDLLARLRQNDHSPPRSIEAARTRCFERLRLETPKSDKSGEYDTGWLSFLPEDRKFILRKSSPTARARLAQHVCFLKELAVDPEILAVPNGSRTRADFPRMNFQPAQLHQAQMHRAQRCQALRRQAWMHQDQRRWIERLPVYLCIPLLSLMLMSGCWTDHSSRVQLSVREASNVEIQSPKFIPKSSNNFAKKSLENDKPAKLANAKSQFGMLKLRSQRWMRFFLNGRPIGYAPVEMAHLPRGQYQLKWQTHGREGLKTIVIRAARVTTLQDGDF